MNDEGALVGGGAVDEGGGIRAVEDDEGGGDTEVDAVEPLVVVIAAAAVVDGVVKGFEVEMVVTTPVVDDLEEMAVAAVTVVERVVVDRLHLYSGQKKKFRESASSILRLRFSFHSSWPLVVESRITHRTVIDSRAFMFAIVI